MIHFFSILNYTFEIYLAVGMTVFPYLYPTLYFISFFFITDTLFAEDTYKSGVLTS